MRDDAGEDRDISERESYLRKKSVAMQRGLCSADHHIL